ncbi:uncharacterized protein J4E92_001695 [Alternaria infectoria]|uniref:uncharacterized protein n=1 Tax=Alternaria infectoria TaxID=45303 RepID=UPI00221E87E2|nr:uncharacterized protein J4E92_001695 [Alternaria infectoria]KAI4936970.1 hypothetical protein J4E92_001695 [Alternaria infectoria]
MTTKHTSASGQTTKVPQSPQPYIKANMSTSQTKNIKTSPPIVSAVMSLLDFPVEVFENVVHELVSVAGVNEAWKLRGVCAITYDIFAKRTLKDLTYISNDLLRHNFGLYLYYRSRVPLDVHPYLPERINNMISYVSEGLGTVTESEKEGLQRDLCDRLGADTTNDEMIRALRGYGSRKGLKPEYLGTPFGAIDQLVAASILGKLGLIKTAMESLRSYDTHPVFGGVLLRATAEGQVPAVKVILEQLDAALQGSHEAQRIRMVVQQDPFACKEWEVSEFNISRAILAAVEHSRPEVLGILSTWYKQAGFTFLKAEYNTFLDTAIRKSSLAVFQRVLDVPYIKKKTTNPITSSQLSLACAKGRQDIVKLCVEEDLIETAAATCAMISGINSNKPEIVNLLIRAGADVNYPTPYYSTIRLALKVAMHKKNPSIIQALIDAGAHLPNIACWSKHEATYAILRHAKIKNDGGHVLEYKHFKRMKRADIEKLGAEGDIVASP